MLKSHKKLTKKELKQDPLVIFTAQAVEYLRKEWIKIGSMILGVIVIITISLYIVKGKDKSEINAYDIVLNAYANNAPESIDLLSKFVDNYSGSKKAAEVLIWLGNNYFAQKDYDSAEKYYMKYINNYSNNPIYQFNAYNGLGGIYEENGDFSKAGKIYEEFLSKYSNSVFAPMMYLNAGKAYYRADDKNAALRNFNKIIESYGDSREKQESTYYIELLTYIDSDDA